MDTIATIDPQLGEHVATAAARLCIEAERAGVAAMTFNDIRLTARSGDTAERIVEMYDRERRLQHEAYINSPEGKADAQRRDDEIAQMQEMHDCIMRDLSALDFTDDIAVLDWLCAMQPCTDHVGVVVRKSDILAAFAAAGFASNVNTGPDYRGDDRDNSFRYLVGQALSTLEHCAIHGMLLDCVRKWKARHAPKL